MRCLRRILARRAEARRQAELLADLRAWADSPPTTPNYPPGYDT